MKMTTLKFLTLAELLLALGAQPLCGQSYTIASHKISGGGGTSTNGPFSVNGTIGQHDASVAMSGGSYSMTGGFWGSTSVVQTMGAPILTITTSGNQAVVSWPASATGWTLQTTSTLGTPTWVNYADPVVNNSVTNSLQAGNLFFRLTRP